MLHLRINHHKISFYENAHHFIRVIWLLNDNSISDISKKIGVGKLCRLNKINNGQINVYFEDLSISLSEIHFGFTSLSYGAIKLASWKSSPTSKHIPISVVSTLCTGQKIGYPNKNKLFQEIIKKAYFNLIL
ncbi:hypothetical protein GMMP1_1570009 [Candidatus Magnetomoraceae bacterium gMMP-1]